MSRTSLLFWNSCSLKNRKYKEKAVFVLNILIAKISLMLKLDFSTQIFLSVLHDVISSPITVCIVIYVLPICNVCVSFFFLLSIDYNSANSKRHFLESFFRLMLKYSKQQQELHPLVEGIYASLHN